MGTLYRLKLNQINSYLIIGWFLRRREDSGVPGKNFSVQSTEPTKLNQHMTLNLGIEPGPHWSVGSFCMYRKALYFWSLGTSCFVFCLLFLLFYVICATVPAEGTGQLESSALTTAPSLLPEFPNLGFKFQCLFTFRFGTENEFERTKT